MTSPATTRIVSTDTQISYVAIGVGLLVGAALAFVGGKHPAFLVAGAALGLLGGFLGQFIAVIMEIHETFGTDYGTIFEHLDDVFDIYKEAAEGTDYLFIGIAGVAGAVSAKQIGDKRP